MLLATFCKNEIKRALALSNDSIKIWYIFPKLILVFIKSNYVILPISAQDYYLKLILHTVKSPIY